MKKLTVILLCLVCAVAQAEVYKCKNAQGGIVYGDTPCGLSGSAPVQSKNTANTGTGSDHENNNAQGFNMEKRNDGFPKDMPIIQSPDAATANCYREHNTTQNFPDPDSSKLVGTSRKFVTVKDVGARQMVTIEIVSKNINGMYASKRPFNCLLMGDGTTINKRAYELL